MTTRLDKVKLIFVDLDETLFHSQTFLCVEDVAKAERQYDAVIDLGDEQQPDIYAAQIRPGSLVLLEHLRNSSDYVYALTNSIKPYARGFNHKLGLGFSNENIITREQLHGLHSAMPLPEFPIADEVEYYLIDNLPRHENYLKTARLNMFFPTATIKQYIRVTDYYGGLGHANPLGENQIGFIMQQIWQGSVNPYLLPRDDKSAILKLDV